MAEVRDSAEVRELLLSREARGLRVPLVGRILLILFGIVNTIAALAFTDTPDASPTLALLVFGVFSTALLLNLRLFALLRQGRHVERVGLVGAVFDALLAVALSALAQMAGAQDNLPVGYVFKTELPVTVLTVVAINGLALRARYPLIVGAGAVVALLLPAVRLLLDPLTQWSGNRTLIYASAATDLSAVVTIIMMAVGLTAAVSFAAHAARQTIRDGIAKEIEHARAQQAQLRAVMREKVTAIARLVAGISHEVNTPIGALVSSVDTQAKILDRVRGVLETHAISDPRADRALKVGQQSLGAMRTAADRISQLEISLRALSHLDEADFRKVDLHHELDHVVTAVRREQGASTQLVFERGELPEVYLAASEFNQALLTLVTHAFEAAGPDGVVTVRTEEVDGSIAVEISDDGPALGAEALVGLFDVSLTTRGERVGAGLGLATAQSVVQRHGGEIGVGSGGDRGTVFRVVIPVGSA